MQIYLKSARRSCCKIWDYFLSLPFRDDYLENGTIVACVMQSVNGGRYQIERQVRKLYYHHFCAKTTLFSMICHAMIAVQTQRK